jgi:hypothetical protein
LSSRLGKMKPSLFFWRHDIHHNDTLQRVTQHNATLYTA